MTKVTVLTSLYNCEKYLKGYFYNVGKLVEKENIEILLLHNAPTDKELEIVKEYIHLYPFIRHIIIKEREGLYSSWNRGIKQADGEYLCIWNVDDVRISDSLLKQAETLDKNPGAVMTYGNYTLVSEYGDEEGILVIEPDSQQYKSIAKVSHIVGCFPMWRKFIHEKIGYFDEQFRLVADYEFQIRVALNYGLVKTDTMLGYFLQGGNERLSQNIQLQNRERTAVELRYGIYYKMNLLYKKKAEDFKIKDVLSFGRYTPISNYIPSYLSYIKGKKVGWFVALFYLPLNYLRYLKNEIYGN